jgi:hypothetical protein
VRCRPALAGRLGELLLAGERFEEARAVAEDSERRFEFLAHPIDTPARAHVESAVADVFEDEAGMMNAIYEEVP